MDIPLTPQQELEQVLADEAQRRAAGLSPAPELAAHRAKLLHDLRRWEESNHACEDADRLLQEQGQPENLELLILQGSNLCQIGLAEDAISISRKAEQACLENGLPVDPRILYNIGSAYIYTGRFEDALAALAETERLTVEQGLPVSQGVIINRGNIYANLGRYEDALAAYDEASRLCISRGQTVYPANFVNRGNIYKYLGRYHEALAAYEEAEQQFLALGMPVFPGVVASRGNIFERMGRHEDALAAYDEAERMCVSQGLPVHPSIETARAATYGKLGRYEDALAAYAKAEQMIGEQGTYVDWSLHFSRAITMYEAGHQAEAVQEVYRAITLCARTGVQQPAFLVETLQDWLSPKPEKLVAEQIASQPEAVQRVPDSEKRYDVFLCYRRDAGHTYSLLLKAHMDLAGRTVFRDQDSLSSGKFLDDIIEAIRYSRHMVIVLTPGFLARCCTEEDDVVRQEIATALHHGTHIIPVMMEGFEWPKPDVLPGDIRALADINAMSYSTEFFTAFIDKLLKWMSG